MIFLGNGERPEKGFRSSAAIATSTSISHGANVTAACLSLRCTIGSMAAMRATSIVARIVEIHHATRQLCSGTVFRAVLDVWRLHYAMPAHRLRQHDGRTTGARRAHGADQSAALSRSSAATKSTGVEEPLLLTVDRISVVSRTGSWQTANPLCTEPPMRRDFTA